MRAARALSACLLTVGVRVRVREQEDTFSADELEQLRVAFAQADLDAMGVIRGADLKLVLTELVG